jgi:hypothetical protein
MNQKTKILNINYLKTLNLLAFNETDCNLTLYFIRENIHFNLRTENDWHEYITNCEEIKIKDKASSKNDYSTRIQFTNSWVFYLAISSLTISIFILAYLFNCYVTYKKI